MLFGPESSPRAPRRSFSAVVINGENLTARQALERYPQLREFLQQNGRISEKSLQAKVRTWVRKGKIPNHIFNPEPEIVPRERLLGNNFIGHHTIHSDGNTSPRDFLNFTRNVVIRFLRERPQNKVQLSLICVMMRVDSATGEVTAEEQASFNSRQESVFGSTDLGEVYERMVAKMLEAFATYLKYGSGWMLKKIVRLDITLSRLRPLRGSSHIPLPKRILKRKAIINMENEDEECFKWAVTRALHPEEKNPQRVTKKLREQSEELNWDGIEFPTPCPERVFKKFEKTNDVSLLVFGHEAVMNNTYIIPLYVPTERREKVVRLFFLKDVNEEEIVSHYCVVKDMSRLVSSQASKKKKKKYVYDFCLNVFGSQELLGDHADYCSKHDAVNTVMLEPGRNILKFKNIQNSVESSVKIYADFESFLEPMDRKHGETKLYRRHVPSAFCFHVVSRVEGFSIDPVTYVSQGQDDQVDRVFVKKLEEVTKKIYETFKESRPMIFDEAAKRLHESQYECYACGEKFDEKKVSLKKVRDHCHYTGKYRGAPYSKCNLRLERTRTIPVFFHNLTGYDCHLFVMRLAESLGDVSCIPRNEEKYVTFNKMVLVHTIVKGEDKEVNVYSRLKFVDTMNFMRISLEKLVGNLGKPSFKHTGKYFRDEELDLMLRKGVYPYEYMTGVERFREKSLPPKEEFASSLLRRGFENSSEFLLREESLSETSAKKRSK